MMRLEKYHGLGNDFLVLLDLGDRCKVDPSAVRALCDRHRGVGADGVIRVTLGPERPSERDRGPTMELFNADGSRAEMSGNGIRCLAMAMVDAGLSGPEMVVHTDAGDKVVTVDDDGWASVDMGMAKIDPKDVGVAFVDMGNPHTVVEVEDLTKLHIAKRAAEWQGRNVEFVVIGPGTDHLSMRVWERGVGETLACGTGACAAAAAAFVWGKVGRHVTVKQPGGNATVRLEGDTIILSGPADHIATVEVPWL
ncbi:MAG: Diaminopimelate epimerase [uncultured Acidimicrobiales bacterium]|uniref:Diaminopimelate epimerase n=1 Tax=uncultured Acidimicrobiales bacterium TaxID=310071 RepID=A0A6J4IUI4_9ACTN|nr:MAG: Diaminopimelate epimerase [uncultured Acidimicrobiales bacterium]